MPGFYEIKAASNGEYVFNLKAANGEIILSSETYKAKKSAEEGIASVQTNSPKEERYAKETAKNGKFYFTLKAANGQVIGKSQMYATTETRDKGVASVQTNGPTTDVRDLTK